MPPEDRDIFAYFMRDGFVYVGKRDYDNKINTEVGLKDFVLIPTSMIAQDTRAPEVVISEEYERKNKGHYMPLGLENKIGCLVISLALRLKESQPELLQG